jgi:hypothetical protein
VYIPRTALAYRIRPPAPLGEMMTLEMAVMVVSKCPNGAIAKRIVVFGNIASLVDSVMGEDGHDLDFFVGLF